MDHVGRGYYAMTSRKAFSSNVLPLLGGGLLVTAWFAADAGSGIPILGVMVALLAPNLFLVGLVVIAAWLASRLAPTRRAAMLLALVLTILFGLNTRIPAIVSDVLQGDADSLQLSARLSGAVGQPIHSVAEPADFEARQRYYAAAGPDCYGDGCLGTKGFRTPVRASTLEYWHEKAADVILAAGFVNAKPAETAPALIVKEQRSKLVSTVHIELVDASGKMLAEYTGRYRNGFPFETKDGVDSRQAGDARMRFEYLLHGGILNWLVGKYVPNGRPYPLTSFLEEVVVLSHPQGSKLGLASRVPPLSGKTFANAVALEILDDKIYVPVWKPKEIPNPNGYASKWQGMPPWDKERHDRCSTLLRPEIEAPITQTWYLFVNDPSGRKKVRISSLNAFCDPDALWFLDYVAEEGNVVITKYRINGDLAYRLSFKKPGLMPGYQGGIPISTFEAEDGYLRFEWWETNHSASKGMEVKRVMKVRLKEPGLAS